MNIVVNYDCPPDADSYLHRVGYVYVFGMMHDAILIMYCTVQFSRAGRFGTKGLAITFVSSESDQQVMAAIQSRFEVAVPELPDRIDPASYSKFFLAEYVFDCTDRLTIMLSDFIITKSDLS